MGWGRNCPTGHSKGDRSMCIYSRTGGSHRHRLLRAPAVSAVRRLEVSSKWAAPASRRPAECGSYSRAHCVRGMFSSLAAQRVLSPSTALSSALAIIPTELLMIRLCSFKCATASNLPVWEHWSLVLVSMPLVVCGRNRMQTDLREEKGE